MSTRVNQTAQINAACRELLNERLDIRLGQTVDLGQLSTALEAGRVDLSGMRSMVGNVELGGVLGKLAPAPFARAQTALAMTENALNPSALTMSVRTDLADAVSQANAVVIGATRDLTVQAFTEAATELGYTFSSWRGADVTGLELWRNNELLLLRVHDGGLVESDHAGLADGSCGDRQRELEAAAARRGITFTGRKQYNHSSYEGGDLIATAATHRESGLAKATVDTHEQLVPAKGGRLFAGASGEPSHRTRELRRGGAA
jgi:hypothetical protein